MSNRKVLKVLRKVFKVKGLSELSTLALVMPRDQLIDKIKQGLNLTNEYFKEYEDRLELAHINIGISSDELTCINSRLTEKNLHLSSLLDSLSEGYLVFDKKGLCLGTYSKSCLSIFKTTEITEKPIVDLLGIEGDEVVIFKQWLELMFKPGAPLESLLDLAPHRLNNDRGLEITLKYKPMFEEGELVGVVVIASDITDLVNEKKNNNRILTDSKKMKAIMTSFNEFKNFRRFYTDVLKKLTAEGSSILEAYELHQDIHSLKGLAGIFHFNHLVRSINKIETRIRKRTDKKNLHTFSQECHEYLENSFLKEMESIKDILSSLEFKESSCEIELSQAIKLLNDVKDPQAVKSIYENLVCAPFSSQIKYYAGELERLAYTMNKKILPLKLVGDAGIPPMQYDKFMQTLIHLFRNIVDHGIEDPEQRKFLGKKEHGEVIMYVSLDKNESNLEIRVRDDGRGIDPQKIIEKMEERNCIDISPDQTDHEIIQNIFHTKFSTSNIMNSISGFGLGVCAVKHEVVSLGGSIRVESKKNVFCEFIITLPYLSYEAFLDQRLNKAA